MSRITRMMNRLGENWRRPEGEGVTTNNAFNIRDIHDIRDIRDIRVIRGSHSGF